MGYSLWVWTFSDKGIYPEIVEYIDNEIADELDEIDYYTDLIAKENAN